MVQLMNSGNFRSESDTCRGKLPVKVEIEDSLEEEHGPFNKKAKFPSPFHQKWSGESGGGVSIQTTTQYNPLDEPSPLGLQLRKSPSLMDLIEMRLSQGKGSMLGGLQDEKVDLGKKKDMKGASSASVDKLKASNFPASLLKIGTWEAVSRYEGDLVAKCYYAKHKLVWEVLDGGLKSKMEIQWSDITALKANFPEDGPGTLDLVLARQPLFFRETNPQPRKHTLWQATADFTGGQASRHRKHFLQCPQGLLNKNFEKLIQCDPRLNWLSHQPEITLENPFFEPKTSIFEDPDETPSPRNNYLHPFPGFHDTTTTTTTTSSPSAIQSSQDTTSPSSVIDPDTVEDNVQSKMMKLKVPGINSSMSMSDLVNHIGNCISEQMTCGNPLFSDGLQNENMLDDIAQYLLSDSQLPASDEKSLMSRVNSLCCLIQKDTVNEGEENVGRVDEHKQGGGGGGGGMTRKDSLGDLLLHLPRIASLPQFLFNIPEDEK